MVPLLLPRVVKGATKYRRWTYHRTDGHIHMTHHRPNGRLEIGSWPHQISASTTRWAYGEKATTYDYSSYHRANMWKEGVATSHPA
jgi:hypothetical protein